MTPRSALSFAAVRAKDTRGHRLVMGAAAIGVTGVLALLVAFLLGRASIAERDASIDTLSQGNERLYSDAVALEDQVVELGGDPVRDPEPAAVVALPGRDGLDGSDGIDGANGVNGQDGADGLDGSDGLNGLDGKDGLDGLPGRDGIDGTNGIDGQNGADGRDGVDGRDGTDGPTCPDGFVPVETDEARSSNGTTYSRSITCVDPTTATPASASLLP